MVSHGAAGWTGNVVWQGDPIKNRSMDIKLLADIGG
ncbi:hypothetical protein JOE34_003439 [Pseudomonas sp. PvP028]|nr:hypothetical protein [Pseudomonas sp. PvP028]